jgi:hypothetical protein
VAGELFIGGAGVSEGYHKRDDLTRDKFVMSPFKDGDRLYRTGDLARWRRDGTFAFTLISWGREIENGWTPDVGSALLPGFGSAPAAIQAFKRVRFLKSTMSRARTRSCEACLAWTI